MFYAYLWLRYCGTPYYVGKGSGNRAFSSHGHVVKPPKDKNRILVQGFESEEDAFEAEKFFISYYGRIELGTGCLRNLTDGGENPPSQKGRKWKLSKLRNGSSYGMLGKPQTEKFKEAMRKSHIGRTLSEESKRKISMSNMGHKTSEESRLKMRIAKLGKKVPNYPKNRKSPSREREKST